jgi:hypothetical protein
VIAIATIIFSFSAPYSLKFYRTQLVEEVRSNIINTLQQARHNAVLQKNDSSFGVTLSEVPESYVLFQGDSYAERETAQDDIFPVISDITFSGLTDVVFAKLTGLPNATGTISVSYGTIVRNILVEDFGVISKSN